MDGAFGLLYLMLNFLPSLFVAGWAYAKTERAIDAVFGFLGSMLLTPIIGGIFVWGIKPRVATGSPAPVDALPCRKCVACSALAAHAGDACRNCGRPLP